MILLPGGLVIVFVLWLLLRKPAPVEQSIDYGETQSGGSGGGTQSATSTTNLGAGTTSALGLLGTILKLFGGGSKSSGGSGGGSGGTQTNTDLQDAWPYVDEPAQYSITGLSGLGGGIDYVALPFDPNAVVGTPISDPDFDQANGLGTVGSLDESASGDGDLGDTGDSVDAGF